MTLELVKPKLEWREDVLFLGELAVGEVGCIDGAYGFLYGRLDRFHRNTADEVRAVVEKSVRDALGWARDE